MIITLNKRSSRDTPQTAGREAEGGAEAVRGCRAQSVAILAIQSFVVLELKQIGLYV